MRAPRVDLHGDQRVVVVVEPPNPLRDGTSRRRPLEVPGPAVVRAADLGRGPRPIPGRSRCRGGGRRSGTRAARRRRRARSAPSTGRRGTRRSRRARRRGRRCTRSATTLRPDVARPRARRTRANVARRPGPPRCTASGRTALQRGRRRRSSVARSVIERRPHELAGTGAGVVAVAAVTSPPRSWRRSRRRPGRAGRRRRAGRARTRGCASGSRRGRSR